MVNAVMSGGNWLASWLATAVDLARRAPGKVLLWVLGIHLVVWTILPILVCRNLQLDLVDGLALGKEWQLGYWKHPPLPWWVADLVYRIVGHVDAVYVLGPLAVVVCFYAVWLLAREVTGELEALVAVLALEGIHFYNFSAVKFAHDQMQLPFWALTGLFLYRAITRERALDWLSGRRFSCAGVLVEIRRLRAGGDARAVPAVRSDCAAGVAHAGPLAHGARLRAGDRAELLVAGRYRLPAVPLRRFPCRRRDRVVSVRHLSAALDREPAALHPAGDRR